MDLKIDLNKEFMKRALLLAKNGEGRVSPNPMVGAVIVHGNRIIGEGFHANYGGPHAEVNAINSVKKENRGLLQDSTIYVTLEPCAHYGKTPPCANLIVETGIPRVVVGSSDPNPKVAGKGIQILKNAGISVYEGFLKNECDELNRRFLTAHQKGRPWVILKWAQSADGFMASINDDGEPSPVRFSNPVSSVWVHKERAAVDAITVGSNTKKIDSPRLDVRLWGGNSPKRIDISGYIDCKDFLKSIAREGITSIMVEGGPTFLQSFISDGLYDEIRVEISPKSLVKGLSAPAIPEGLTVCSVCQIRENTIITFRS